MESDKAAIEAIMQGDRDRFSVLVERNKRMVYAIAWSYLGDADMCEDAAQTTFIRAYRYLGALRDVERFPAWLSRIARNVSTSLMRRRRTELENRKRWQMEQPSSVTTPADTANDESLKETLGQFMAELPPQHREGLVLYYLEGKSITEAASALGISESAMKTRLHRARRVLRGRLEQEIEQGLEGLAPRKGFGASVMVLLPAKPFGAVAVGGGASLVGKAGSWLGSALPGALFVLWMVLSQVTFIYLLMGWFARMESANIVDKPENEFRKALLRRNVVTMSIVTFCVLIVAIHGIPILSFSTYIQIIAVFCVWGCYKSLRLLRVNRSPYIKGQVLASFFLFASSALIGFFGAPFAVFIVGLLLLNIVLARTNRLMPRRQDYNLFLREANENLGETEPESSSARSATESELRGFARFLGEHYLVRDYSIRGDAITLRLPPVRIGLLNHLLMSTVGDSVVKIQKDGQCQSHLARSDAKDIRTLTGQVVDKISLEENVAQAVQGALSYFLQGKDDAARQALSAVDDKDIFIADFSKTRGFRFQALVPIIAAIVLVVAFSNILPGFWGDGGPYQFQRWRPKPVSQAMARQAIGEWIQEDPRTAGTSLRSLWIGPIHPSLEMIGEQNVDAYRAIIYQELKMDFNESEPGAVDARILTGLLRPRLLYHALTTPILSAEELESLKFESDRVREALSDHHDYYRNKLFTLRERFLQRSMTRYGLTIKTFQTHDIATFAIRLRVLRYLDCLDFVDFDAMANTIADQQVTSNFRIPDGYSPVDLARSAGLFNFGMCTLRETWAALVVLEALDQMDLIDREACIGGILRFYKGEGVFRADNPRESGVLIYGQEEDAFYAMEALALLNALDRIDDLQKWKFHPITQPATVGGMIRPSIVTNAALLSWAYQERLEHHQADRTR